MPLKCLREGLPIYSFDCEADAAWLALRLANASNSSLSMHCCGAGVVLRTSKLGTRHFAHARRGPCATAPESAQHLLAKRAIVEGLRRTEWTAATEERGDSPGHGSWVADVLATQGRKKVAIEVQWSRQDGEETLRRQARYAAGGVRGLWLFRQHDFPVSKDCPAFRLVLDNDGHHFAVKLPSPQYSPSWMRPGERDDTRYWQQTIELSRFVEGALSGRLRFAPALDMTMPVEVLTEAAQCWRCKKETRLVLQLRFAAGRVLPDCADIELPYRLFDEIDDGERVVANMLSAGLLKRHGIGELRRRYSKTEGGSYLSNGCVHCDALQGRFFEHNYGYNLEPSFEIEARLDRAWEPWVKDASDIYLWWLDERGLP